ncbi:phytoene/squalene synthase family protein [Sphingomonas alpina]|uniref:Phytoene/squalene synthase family protein n=1 Tax=Sphingomonas alpina TaxID=653931 RepID=A0A7H0LHJ6_9SPHN|nr:phytoene/squalene synthase family protein [Sphingomonas alpina]QNQ09149.1 phytoene/squalene synthase family protein [Sphingomonas alpina]
MSQATALPTRDAIVATARESIARGSKSFAAASTLFSPATRERAWLLYAWCRACDDIADGQDHGHGMSVVTDAPARLERMRAMTEAALAGKPVGEPAFDALRIVAAETHLPHGFAHDLIEGFALDARDWRPRSEADLYKYCYHVAGVVGCMMAVIMGVSPDDEATLDRACDLGMAFQLANIARDIEEDDRVGRCYVPEEWLVEMDIPPGQHMKPPFRRRLAVLARRLADRAALFEASSRIGTTKLDLRSAWAVLSAAGIYGAIGRKVAAGGEHAWDHRVTTSKAAKIGFIARALVEAMRRQALYPDSPRDPGLWTRPEVLPQRARTQR